jgi:lipopolysaccharide biosynthesis protein
MKSPIAKLIAFYLPQYHPIPENDAWWGKGFTEWTNVVKAKPLFNGHYQPHIPADLGFYDLRVPETRQAQADLAKEYGIDGFCYYHYWFNGKRLLERPFQEVLELGEPDFPFCLCWANENWTRVWDGSENHILMKQNYSQEDDLNHIRSLFKSFADPRYIRIEGKPLFLVYRISNMPEPKRTTDIWREEYLKRGFGELFLCKVESSRKDHMDPKKDGFDAAVEFQPDVRFLKNPIRRGKFWKYLTKLGISSNTYQQNSILKYESLVEQALNNPQPEYERFRCVTPSWDNSPRKKDNCHILINSSPQLYEKWLTSVLKLSIEDSRKNNLVFINAWNEWGESNHLEPDTRYGLAYLEATRRAIMSFH